MMRVGLLRYWWHGRPARDPSALASQDLLGVGPADGEGSRDFGIGQNKATVQRDTMMA
jgi:hypothetical protein